MNKGTHCSTFYIYGIFHNKTERMYIGMSHDVKRRYREHLSKLKNKKHHVPLMQDEYDKHGCDYTIFILAEAPNSMWIRELERKAQIEYQTNVNGYNYKERYDQEWLNGKYGDPWRWLKRYNLDLLETPYVYEMREA